MSIFGPKNDTLQWQSRQTNEKGVTKGSFAKMRINFESMWRWHFLFINERILLYTMCERMFE